MLLFLIPESYVKGHYFLFYNIKKEMSVYLGLSEQLFDDPLFYRQLHNILINYIYFKFYFFLVNKKENPFFGSYQFNVLESKFLLYLTTKNFFQYDYLMYYLFYRLFFGLKKNQHNRVLITRITMWEIASSRYSNLINYIPVKILYKKYSMSAALSDLVSRLSQKIWSGAIYYEYRFGKIRIRTKARWTRERENEIETQQRLERLWHSFFWNETSDLPPEVQNLKELRVLNVWKTSNHERLIALTAFMQHSNRIQRKLRFDAQMTYVRSLRYGKRKWMFVKLSMKHWW